MRNTIRISRSGLLFAHDSFTPNLRSILTVNPQAKIAFRVPLRGRRPILRRSFTKHGNSGNSSSVDSNSEASSGLSFLRSVLAWYSKRLDTHPVTTKCISAGIISGTGNILTQGFVMKAEDDDNEKGGVLERVDWGQTSRFAILNVVVVAPILHVWYNFLHNFVPGKSLWIVAKRVFWDEFMFSPIYVPFLMGSVWKMEGQLTNQEILDKLWTDTFGILVVEWAIYVPVQFINFWFFPVKWQVLFSNSVGVVWNAFVSYMAFHVHEDSNDDTNMDRRKNDPELVVEESQKVASA